ncbi:MAG: hypothetical protein LBD21_05670 [Tannerellaceae bacterium]|nr:hypothetical protein [Tannerellaceae bacterium]
MKFSCVEHARAPVWSTPVRLCGARPCACVEHARAPVWSTPVRLCGE